MEDSLASADWDSLHDVRDDHSSAYNKENVPTSSYASSTSAKEPDAAPVQRKARRHESAKSKESKKTNAKLAFDLTSKPNNHEEGRGRPELVSGRQAGAGWKTSRQAKLSPLQGLGSLTRYQGSDGLRSMSPCSAVSRP